jgi:hypothetical protein
MQSLVMIVVQLALVEVVTRVRGKRLAVQRSVLGALCLLHSIL